MARKKQSAPVAKERTPIFDDLSPQAKQAIGAVVVGVLGIFFLFSLLGFAGRAGELTDVGLTWLFGAGAWLAPIAAAFYVYALMNPREDERVSVSKVLGISLVFVGVLALLELYEVDLGGMTGLALTYPLTFIVGNMVTGVLLFGFILIGSFLIFNTGLSLPKLRRNKTDNEMETDDLGLDDLDLPELKEKPSKVKEEKAEEVPEEETEPKKGLSGVAGKITDTLGIEKNVGDIVVKHFSGPYIPPSLTLLNKDKGKAMAGDVKANSLTIKRTLKEFGINVEMDAVESGPAITRYSLKPAQGVRISRIVASATRAPACP